MSDVGYLRVSSFDQNTARQLDGVHLDERFEDKASAATADRPGLKECLRFLRRGDTLHVHSIDRLARNLRDLMNMLKDLTARGVTVRFHKENLTFSNADNPFLTLQLQIIGATAEFERAMIRERQKEGIAKAQKMGVKCGRAPKLTPEQEAELAAKVRNGAERKDMVKEYGVSKSSVFNILKRHGVI